MKHGGYVVSVTKVYFLLHECGSLCWKPCTACLYRLEVGPVMLIRRLGSGFWVLRYRKYLCEERQSGVGIAVSSPRRSVRIKEKQENVCLYECVCV